MEATGLDDMDGDERLGNLLGGFVGTQLLYVVTELGVADALGEGAQSIDALAERLNVVPHVLYRFLRALATYGVFEQDAAGKFRNTPASELLRRDDDSGWRDYAIVYGSVYRAFAEALSAARTGENMFSRVHGVDWWTWLERNPQIGTIFNRAMQAGAQGRIELISGVAWEDDETVVDVGGGNGTLVIELLQRQSQLKGVVFDLPEVAVEAEARVEAAGLSDRCRVVPGSFFDAVPTGGDVYLLAKVLHDWDDAAAIRILSTVRAAAPDHARLLVIDSVVPAGNAPHPSKALDLVMLSLVNGRERGEDEWTKLLELGGFRPVSIGDGLVQAVPS
ncbi:MAG: acetylserotonin O-methyltransferase [Actinomycetota bacterium]|nr:acetylserotonin O-methyltransferase [Actinomycetota bacterium]